jgi:hypothetical protein
MGGTRPRRVSEQPDQHARKMDEGQEVASQLVKAHRDVTEAFDALEEVLNQAALAVKVPIDGALDGAPGVGPDDWRAPVGVQQGDQPTGVVGGIACDYASVMSPRSSYASFISWV